MGQLGERQLARQSMGFCLQQNVCYDSLSAHEHLLFIAKLRGLNLKTGLKQVSNQMGACGKSLKISCT